MGETRCLRRAILPAAVVLALTWGGSGRAEFKVDDALPGTTIKDKSDVLFSLKREEGQVAITVNKDTTKPKVVVLHLFQPDCLQCQDQAKALEKLHKDTAKRGVLVVGIAHRGDDKAVRDYADRLKVSFPLVVGTGSDFVKKFAAGDAFCIADNRGIVRYAQVGYGAGDEELWLKGVESLLAGKPIAKKTVEREGLRVGDRLPVIELNSLMTGKPMVLKSEDGKLTFQDDKGKAIKPKAVIGMFSRY
jgi:peroxiredoxin